MVTGPLAVGSWLLPVLPPLMLGLVAVDELPLPPHAARVRRPTDDRATSGALILMYAPSVGRDESRRPLAGGAPEGVTRSAWPDLTPTQAADNRGLISRE